MVYGLPLEKAMAPHSSTLAWKIPWTEEPGRLQSMGSAKSQTRLSDFTFTFHFHALEKEMATHSRWSSWLRDWTLSSCIGRQILHCWATREAHAAAAKSLQSCPTLCDPIDQSPPGSAIPGILQARTLEWVAISFSNSLVHSVSYFEMCSKLHFVIVAFPKDMMSQHQHFDLNKKGSPWMGKYKHRT